MSEITVTSECLLKIRDLIVEHGWVQGDYGNTSMGYCLIGAWSAACLDWDIWEHDGDPPLDAPADLDWSQPLADALDCPDGVANWNDDDSTTVEEVIELLVHRAAALK